MQMSIKIHMAVDRIAEHDQLNSAKTLTMILPSTQCNRGHCKKLYSAEIHESTHLGYNSWSL